MQRLAGIGERGGADPDGVALVDEAGTQTWAEVAGQVDAVGGELLAVAPGPDDRVAVVGENLAPTLMAHAAGILAGVGTVAVSRQLTAQEMADQFRDAGVTAVVTGPAGLAAAVGAARESGVGTVVVHSTDEAPKGTTSWRAWSSGGRALPSSTDRPARPPLVYTSGTTGKARGTPVRWAPSTITSAAEYAEVLAGRSGFPAGPHLVVGPLQHNGPLTAVRHLLSGQPVVVLGRFDAERVLDLIQRHRVTSSVMVPTHFSRLLALPADAPCPSPRTARRDRPWSTRPARPARRAAHRSGGHRPPSPRPPSTPRSSPAGPASPRARTWSSGRCSTTVRSPRCATCSRASRSSSSGGSTPSASCSWSSGTG